MSQLQNFLFVDRTDVANEYYDRRLKRIFLEDKDTSSKNREDQDTGNEDSDDEDEPPKIEVRCKSATDLDEYRVRGELGHKVCNVISTVSSTDNAKMLHAVPGMHKRVESQEFPKPGLVQAACLGTGRLQFEGLFATSLTVSYRRPSSNFAGHEKVQMVFQIDAHGDARRQCLDHLTDGTRLTIVSQNPYVTSYNASAYEVCTEQNIEIVLKQDADLKCLDRSSRRKFATTIQTKAQNMYIAILGTTLPMSVLKHISDRCSSKPNFIPQSRLPLTPTEYPRFKSLDPLQVEQFRSNQLRFLPFMLHEGTYDSVLQTLPYGNTSKIGKGSIGAVSSVSLYNHLHSFPSAWSPCGDDALSRNRFAIKFIAEKYHVYAIREQEFLEKIGPVNHRNILATADLEAFMRAEKVFVPAQRLKAQMRGLAGAVRLIHSGVGGYAGHSHDIKLQNILVFEESQWDCLEWKLADWSCAKMNARVDDSSHRTETFGGNTWCPPEIAPNAKNKREGTSRPHDVWSLGCVFLELIVWHDGGWHAVQEFRTQRREDDDSDYAFSTGRKSDKRLRPSVTSQISRLRTMTEWSGFITVIEGMLAIDPINRCSAEEIVVHLI
ncbi:kinase-like protein [Karstenula rhodostoma CBS 690.94]|uniref:Kinase-like protein n=1 Tax=Karstenula rhodostoma CBS 690.94 TaxID=1392251 RepID=A0A9P4PEK8_9PLEO|nr:kinase-like protein [Karstenula rhodostoma CBS 690.94]